MYHYKEQKLLAIDFVDEKAVLDIEETKAMFIEKAYNFSQDAFDEQLLSDRNLDFLTPPRRYKF